MTIYYQDTFALGSIPGGTGADHSRQASGVGITGLSAISSIGGTNTRTQSGNGLLCSASIGGDWYGMYIYPSDGSGNVVDQTLAPGMFAIARILIPSTALSFQLILADATNVIAGTGLQFFASPADALANSYYVVNVKNQANATVLQNIMLAPFYGTGTASTYSMIEMDFAFVVRNAVGGGWNVECWTRNSMAGNINTADWQLSGIVQQTFSAAKVAPAILVNHNIGAAGACSLVVLDFVFGIGDPTQDPGVISRIHGIGLSQASFAGGSYTNVGLSGAALSAGVVKTSTALTAFVNEGLYELSGDVVVNAYQPTDSTLAAWTKISQPFGVTTAAGITFQYTGAGTGGYTIGINGAGDKRVWTPVVNSTPGTPINLGSGLAYGTAITLATLVAAVPANWTFSLTSGAVGTNSALYLPDVTVADAKTNPVAQAVNVPPWNSVIVQKTGTDTLLATCLRYTNNSTSGNIVARLSTDGGVTWGTEYTIATGVTTAPTSGFWSAALGKFVVVVYSSFGTYISATGLSGSWTSQPYVSINPTEPYACELPDGTWLFMGRAAGNAEYAYSTDSGVTWSSLNECDGSYSGGSPLRSYIYSGSAPLACWYAYGHLWVIAPDPTSYGPRERLVLYRSPSAVTRTTLAAGLVLLPWKRAEIQSQGGGNLPTAAYPYACVNGLALAIGLGRDINRFFYDPDFFDADAIGSGTTDPGPTNVLNGVTYLGASGTETGSYPSTATTQAAQQSTDIGIINSNYLPDILNTAAITLGAYTSYYGTAQQNVTNNVTTYSLAKTDVVQNSQPQKWIGPFWTSAGVVLSGLAPTLTVTLPGTTTPIPATGTIGNGGVTNSEGKVPYTFSATETATLGELTMTGYVSGSLEWSANYQIGIINGGISITTETEVIQSNS